MCPYFLNRQAKKKRGNACHVPLRARVRVRLPQKCWSCSVVWKELDSPAHAIVSCISFRVSSVCSRRAHAQTPTPNRHVTCASLPRTNSSPRPLSCRAAHLSVDEKLHYIITHFEQHPASASPSLTSIGLIAPLVLDAPLPVE